MRDIRSALDDLLPHLRPGHTIVLRSTIAPGTTDSSPATSSASAACAPGVDVHVAHVPERIATGKFLQRSTRCRASSAPSAARPPASTSPPVRGLRRADRADDAGAGGAGEDLGEHPALHALRAAQPADDGLRAVRRERVRGDRPDQPRLPARRDRAAGLHRRHLPAQGLHVLRGALERARHAAGRLARERVGPALPRAGDEAPLARADAQRPQGRRARARLQGQHRRRARLARAQAGPPARARAGRRGRARPGRRLADAAARGRAARGARRRRGGEPRGLRAARDARRDRRARRRPTASSSTRGTTSAPARCSRSRTS